MFHVKIGINNFVILLKIKSFINWYSDNFCGNTFWEGSSQRFAVAIALRHS
jgi:hypothetical protein